MVIRSLKARQTRLGSESWADSGDNLNYLLFSYSEWWRYKGSVKPRQPHEVEGASLSELTRTIRGFDYEKLSPLVQRAFFCL